MKIERLTVERVDFVDFCEKYNISLVLIERPVDISPRVEAYLGGCLITDVNIFGPAIGKGADEREAVADLVKKLERRDIELFTAAGVKCIKIPYLSIDWDKFYEGGRR